MVEQWPFKPLVGGSIPSTLIEKKPPFSGGFFVSFYFPGAILVLFWIKVTLLFPACIQLLIYTSNGLRYWRWGMRGLCLGAEKNRS